MREFELKIWRKWGTQKTTMTVYNQNEEGSDGNILVLSTPLDEFIKSVKEEIGQVTWVFTKKEFDKRFDDAIEKVLKEIGKATTPFAANVPVE